MLHKYKSIFVSIFILLIFLCIPSKVRAETHIKLRSIPTGSHWTKQLSPYILDTDVDLASGRIFTIDPGVVIMTASSTSEFDRPHKMFFSGTLNASGTAEEPIHFIDLDYISLPDIVDGLSYLWFDNTSLYFSQSTTTLRHIKISNVVGRNAIFASRSYLDIEDSEIVDNESAIFSALWAPVFQVYNSQLNEGEEGFGGIGNALGDDPVQNRITIRNTVFERNTKFSIKNMNSNLINATNNWWGSTAGPTVGNVVGAVLVDPWATKDPRIKRTECCSNVLFLPGLKASRLYRDDKDVLGGGITTHRSWEPFTSNDVKKLFLNQDGMSFGSSTAYTSDIIESAFGVVGIYKKFVAMMNSVVAEKKINSWLPFAYDWRMNPTGVVLDGTLYASSTKRLVNEVIRLSDSSQTGRVTIIAHSNGGLVAKALGQELQRQGKSDLVDKVIMVAVPELGTPEAVAALLHGDDQSLLKGFVLPAGVARTFGLTMPGAYGLLPTTEYFNRIVTPVVTFAGKAVGTYSAFTNFLTGKSDGRKQPIETDLKSPTVLSSGLIGKATSMHSLLDTWRFPTTTAVVSLVGWGTPTTQSIEYSSSTPTLRKGPEGDGTVVSASAAGYSGENGGDNIYFNQGLFNHDLKKDISHAVILEADPLQTLLSKVIATSSLASVVNAPLPQYLTHEKPDANNYPWMSWLTVSVHSPVDMDIYDSHGGHMGLVPLPTDPTSDIMYFENTIGGQYDAIGDEKYYTLPSGDTYNVKLKGTGTGNFTFQVQKFVGGSMTEVANTVYTDLPVTPLLTGSTTITSTVLTPPLNLDVNGDGKTDIKAMPSKTLNPTLHLEAMKTLILSLHLKPAIEQSLLRRITRLQSVIDERTKKGKPFVWRQPLIQKILGGHWGLLQLTDSRRQSLQTSYEILLDALEKD